MQKKNLTTFAVMGALIVAAIAVFVVYFSGLMDSTASVILPTPQASESASSDDTQNTDTGAFDGVTVTPENVQAALKILNRSESYYGLYTVDTFWTSGSNTSTVSVYVRNGVRRISIASGSSQTEKNILVTDEDVYIWYGDGPDYYSGPLGVLGDGIHAADAFSMLLTYEDVLDIDTSRISEAGYVDYNGVYCIYLSVVSEDGAYTESYWISPDTGILQGAATLEDGTLVTSISCDEFSVSAPSDQQFTLPDGTLLP